MKKFIALFLALVLCIGLVACGNPGTEQPTNSPAPVEPSPVPSEPANPSPAPEQPSAEPVNAAANAIAYIKNVYKKAAEITSKDFQRIGTVPVGAEKVVVVWTVDVAEDLVKIVVGEDGMVTVDVNENCTAETPYVLTATVTGADGKTESLSWNHILPAAMNVDGLTYAEIVDLAYALEDQVSTEDPYRLFGTVKSIDTAWSEDYGNITVTIVVAGKEEQPIQCYRLKGEGAKDLKVGDQITVEGILKNYKGTYEFDAGCQLIGYGEHVDQKALLKAAFALADGASLDYPAVLTGVVKEIPSAWSDEYGNITVNLEFDGQILQCYRLTGAGAKDIKVGDTITVVGMIKNYKGLIEFDKGCVMIPNELYHSAKNALSGYKLLDGEAQEVTKTITGTISNIDTAWNPDYQNITVTIVVGGAESYPIMCYRLKGEGASTLAVGDTITVTGILKNYKGTIEFDAGCTLDAILTDSPAAPVDPSEPAEEPAPVVAPTNPAEIVDAAYALESGASLPYSCTLTGAVVTIDTPYSEQYGNITVSIAVAGKEEQPIMCYRLKGEGAAALEVGNIVTVTGTIMNYNGTIEFGSGCTLDAVVVVPTDAAGIIAAAYAMGENDTLPYASTLTGTITSIDTAYSEQYGNITVTIAVEGFEDQPIQCYRLKGEDAAELAVGDVITVSGTLSTYKSKVQFKAGCTVDAVVKGTAQPELVSDPEYLQTSGEFVSDHGVIIAYPDGGYCLVLDGDISLYDYMFAEGRLIFTGEFMDASGASVTMKAVFGYTAEGPIFLADESSNVSIPHGTIFVYDGWNGDPI